MWEEPSRKGRYPDLALRPRCGQSQAAARGPIRSPSQRDNCAGDYGYGAPRSAGTQSGSTWIRGIVPPLTLPPRTGPGDTLESGLGRGERSDGEESPYRRAGHLQATGDRGRAGERAEHRGGLSQT